MNLMGHESEDEEHYALDVDGSEPGTWNADDGSYHSSTEPGSEDIHSDAEVMGAESCDTVPAAYLEQKRVWNVRFCAAMAIHIEHLVLFVRSHY